MEKEQGVTWSSAPPILKLKETGAYKIQDRPSLSFKELSADKIKITKAWDPSILRSNNYYIFTGVEYGKFGVEQFKKLYDSFVECRANPTQHQMFLTSIFKSIKISGSLISPKQPGTFSSYGVLLEVPPKLIYSTSDYDSAKETHPDLLATKGYQQKSWPHKSFSDV